MRLDTFLGRRQTLHSRTFFQQLIKDGRVLVNGEVAKSSYPIEGGEAIRIDFPPADDPWPAPQDLPVEIIHHDDDIIIVNKAAGMVVHPAAGNPDGTLVNALLHRFPDLPGINGIKRPGLVHRLDRETSGVMVVAKNDRSMRILSDAIRDRSMTRRYAALLIGDPDWDLHTIDAPIGRHETMRVKRAVNGEGARSATTHLKVIARSPHGFALVRCQLETGRTHQIRVHCAHEQLPIVGDAIYGGTLERAIEKVRNANSAVRGALQRLERPFLHARLLRLRHPATNQWQVYTAPLPEDLRVVIEALFPEWDYEANFATSFVGPLKDANGRLI